MVPDTAAVVVLAGAGARVGVIAAASVEVAVASLTAVVGVATPPTMGLVLLLVRRYGFW